MRDHGHDNLHQRNDDPYWSETAWFSFMIPEIDLHGMFYIYYRPNLSLAGGGPIVWDRSAEEIYDCLYFGMEQYMPMPPGAKMFDASFDNSATVRTITPGHSIHYTYSAHGCEMDLIYESFMEPHLKENSIKSEDQLQGWWAGLNVGHYDQMGTMRGTVTLEGKQYKIDCYSMRDRSWGPRKLTPCRLSHNWAIASPQHNFLVASSAVLPVEEDPVLGTIDRIWSGSGWITRDGVKSTVVEGTRKVVERGTDGRPLLEVVEAVDELGRKLYAEGRPQNLLKITVYGVWFDWHSLTQWRFDGVTAYGETQDYHTFPHYRNLQKTLAAAKR